MSTMNHERDEAGFVKLGAMAASMGMEHPVIFDVGGNVGQSIDRFDAMFAARTIHSFEPHPQAFDALNEGYGDRDDVYCIDVALGEAPGKARFHAAYLSEVSSLLPPEPFVVERSVNNNYAHDEIEVTVDTLDRYVEDRGVEHIDIMKLDVQGAETQVLAGARETLDAGRIALVFAEVQFAENYSGQCYFDDVWGALKEHGYRLWDLFPFLHTSAGRIWTGNAIFTSPAAFAGLESQVFRK